MQNYLEKKIKIKDYNFKIKKYYIVYLGNFPIFENQI